jgi:hypothetical protein
VISRPSPGANLRQQAIACWTSTPTAATLNGYAASVVECDLEDLAAPGRAFRLVANPPYVLTSAVLSFVARSPYLAARIWFYREQSCDAWSTRAAAT